MTYQHIIDRVIENISSDKDLTANQKDAVIVKKVKHLLNDTVSELVVKTQYSKNEATLTIAETDTYKALPIDFFMGLGVIFKNEEGVILDSVEIVYEEYLKWNPTTDLSETSFSDIAEGNINTIPITEENVRYDGRLGYTFDYDAMQIKFKPTFTGTILLYYVKDFPIDADANASPNIHNAFSEALVIGTTIRYLTSRMANMSQDIGFYGLTTALKTYQTRYNDIKAEILDWVNRTIEVQKVRPFNFINDDTMLI